MGKHYKQGINDIRTKRPDIATHMDNYNTYHKITNKNIPEQISYSGKDHIYLRCEHGHDFDGIANKINQRKRDENGVIYCPKCHELGIRKMPYTPRKTFRQSLYDYCLENNKQYLLDEWNYGENNKLGIDPKNIGRGSNTKVYWTCPLGHIYDMSVSDRTEGGSCQYCSGRRLLIGFNDLLSQYPEVCKDWDYKKNKKRPEEYLQHSSDKVHWRCHKCGHEWETEIGHRTSKTNPSGCPNCINHGMSRIEMCIYLSILQYFPDTKYRYKIDGIEFDVYIPSLNFAIEYDGMYYHKENKAKRDAKKDMKAKEKNIAFLRIKETKDISETHLFKDNILYLNVKYNTKYKENCEIILQHLRDNFNINIGTSVPENVIHTAIAKMGIVNYENSLEAKRPDIAKQLHPTKNHGLTADKIDYASHIKLWFVCPNCGNEFEKEVYRMTDKRYAQAGKCKYCTGQARKKGYNDLETLFPGIIEFWDFEKNKEIGLDFYEMSKSSIKYAHWKFPFTENNYIQIRSAVKKYEEKYL